VKLIRIQYGPYKLGNLKEGKIEEIKEIKDA
jgi:16S rRNA U516 pseudouridylate synthase RsuA-like enzyme